MKVLRFLAGRHFAYILSDVTRDFMPLTYIFLIKKGVEKLFIVFTEVDFLSSFDGFFKECVHLVDICFQCFKYVGGYVQAFGGAVAEHVLIVDNLNIGEKAVDGGLGFGYIVGPAPVKCFGLLRSFELGVDQLADVHINICVVFNELFSEAGGAWLLHWHYRHGRLGVFLICGAGA